jgi:hypothetical protein
VDHDFGGEHVQLWRDAIAETDPSGILYLVRADDALQRNERFRRAVDKLRHYILEPCAAQRGRLNSPYVLVTFQDMLSAEQAHIAVRNVETAVLDELKRPNHIALGNSLQLGGVRESGRRAEQGRRRLRSICSLPLQLEGVTMG